MHNIYPWTLVIILNKTLSHYGNLPRLSWCTDTSTDLCFFFNPADVQEYIIIILFPSGQSPPFPHYIICIGDSGGDSVIITYYYIHKSQYTDHARTLTTSTDTFSASNRYEFGLQKSQWWSQWLTEIKVSIEPAVLQKQ